MVEVDMYVCACVFVLFRGIYLFFLLKKTIIRVCALIQELRAFRTKNKQKVRSTLKKN